MDWKVIFDGIGSELIGVVVTIGAVLLTLRHERTVRRDERLVDETLRLARVATDLHQAGILGQLSDSFLDAFTWSTECRALVTQTLVKEPCFGAILTAALDRYVKNLVGSAEKGKFVPTSQLNSNLGTAAGMLQKRVIDPDFFKMKKDLCDWYVGEIRKDRFVS